MTGFDKEKQRLQDIVQDSSLDFTYKLGCLVNQQAFDIPLELIVEAIKEAFAVEGYTNKSGQTRAEKSQYGVEL